MTIRNTLSTLAIVTIGAAIVFFAMPSMAPYNPVGWGVEVAPEDVVKETFTGRRRAWHGGSVGPKIPVLYVEARLAGTEYRRGHAAMDHGVVRIDYTNRSVERQFVWNPYEDIVSFGDQTFDRKEGYAFAIEPTESGDSLILQRIPTPATDQR